MPGKYYFAGPIPSNEALSRGLLYPMNICRNYWLSISMARTHTAAVPVAFGMLELEQLRC